MIVKGIKPNEGIFFAVWPRRVRGVGLVAWEWLHYKWEPGSGWGDGGWWEYTRWVPEDRYQAGERAAHVSHHGEPLDKWFAMTRDEKIKYRDTGKFPERLNGCSQR